MIKPGRINRNIIISLIFIAVYAINGLCLRLKLEKDKNHPLCFKNKKNRPFLHTVPFTDRWI